MRSHTLGWHTVMHGYIKLIRPVNALLSAIGVSLGFWLSSVQASVMDLVLLIIAAVAALGYGNVINDIKDRDGDRINHPDRPLPNGIVSTTNAVIFSLLLALVSIGASASVSVYHCVGVIIPLLFLTLYTLFMKATPLFGNILVSLLVGYTILFGGMGSNHFTILIIPALLAFLLNLSREIVKDVQDRAGDLQMGVKTTATLSPKALTISLFIPSILYAVLVTFPYLFDHFGLIYLIWCICILLPLHAYWFVQLVKKRGDKRYAHISTAIKLEMLGGLAALAVDRLSEGIL